MGASTSELGKPVVLGLVGLALVAIVVVAATVLWIDGSIERSEVAGLGEDETSDVDVADPGSQGDGDGQADDDPPSPDALTILVLGSDARDVLTPEERRELSTGDAEGERTESIALVRLDPDADSIRMLSIPRDTLITRCDGSRGRINAAYAIGEREGYGGMTCIVRTLTQWSGLTIDHVAKVDFRGFVDIVDRLGGVPMELDEPISDRDAGLDLPAGCNRLDGADALAFVRARSIDDDYGRQARQQRLVEELRREVASIGMFDDPVRLVRTTEATARNLELDSSLTLNRIQQLARQHRETLRLPIEAESLPGEMDDSDGTAFLRVDEQRAAELFEWLEVGPDDEVEPEDGPDDVDGDPDGDGPAGSERDDGDPDGDGPAPAGSELDDDEPAC